MGEQGGRSLGIREMVMNVFSATIKNRGKDLEDELKPYLQDKEKKLENAEQIQIQMKVGDLSNLQQANTNIEKMFRDAIAATARNTT